MEVVEVLDTLFNPKSVALIGATTKTDRLGYSMFHNIVYSGYKGKIYPINPTKSGKIFDRKFYPTVAEVPTAVDLAIIVVGHKFILDAIEDCIEANVKVAVVITAGFREAGEKGYQLEKQMIKKANQGNLRLVGPNCMGVLSTPVNLSVMIWPYEIQESMIGGFSFISQSGNLGTLGLNMAFDLSLGVSRFVSAGNASDIHLEDYLAYLETDPTTKIIGIYMEGIQDGRRFVKIAKRVSKSKPIIVVKAGKNEGGARAAKSHTGALSGKDEIFNAAFKKAGIIRVDDFTEMIKIAKAYLTLPLPHGKRVAILTNGGGWGVMGADAVVGQNLKLPKLSKESEQAIKELLPPFWIPNNPVDMIAAFDVQLSQKITTILLQDSNFDCLFLLGLDVASFLAKINLKSSLNSKEVKERSKKKLAVTKRSLVDLVDLHKKYTKPIYVASFLEDKDSNALNTLIKSGYPAFKNVDKMAKAYRLLFEYYSWRQNNS